MLNATGPGAGRDILQSLFAFRGEKVKALGRLSFPPTPASGSTVGTAQSCT